MKLLIINYMALPVPPVKGGAVEYLVDAFLRDNEKNHFHDIVVYSIYDAAAQEESKNYNYTEFKFVKIDRTADKISRIARHLINRLPNVYIGNVYISKVVRRERDLNQYDAVIIENAPEFGLKIPKTFQNRLILHLHNDYLNSNSKQARKIFNRYDEIYTISNSLGACVQTIERSNKVKTLYNGIDLDRFAPRPDMRAHMRQKYNIAADDFVFMYCGRIVPDKGVLELAEAFGAIKDDKVKLFIVGGIGYSNQETSAYKEQVLKAAGHNVICTGFVPYAEMPLLYAIPDVGVVPSIFNDPFNLTAIEFCANGVPLVISDRGAMKELVNSNCAVIAKCDETFAANIYQALQHMLENRSGLGEMGAAAKKVSEEFGIDQYCGRFNKLLANV